MSSKRGDGQISKHGRERERGQWRGLERKEERNTLGKIKILRRAAIAEALRGEGRRGGHAAIGWDGLAGSKALQAQGQRKNPAEERAGL